MQLTPLVPFEKATANYPPSGSPKGSQGLPRAPKGSEVQRGPSRSILVELVAQVFITAAELYETLVEPSKQVPGRGWVLAPSKCQVKKGPSKTAKIDMGHVLYIHHILYVPIFSLPSKHLAISAF